jgi:hypothetical protein
VMYPFQVSKGFRDSSPTTPSDVIASGVREWPPPDRWRLGGVSGRLG